MFFDELSNDEWALLSALVSDEPAVRLNRRGRPRAEPRIVANAVLWILTTGEPWSKLPGRYPSGPTCRRRFEEWQLNGTLLDMVRLLSQTGRTFAYVPQPAPPAAAKPAAPEAPAPIARDEAMRGVSWRSPESWQAPGQSNGASHTLTHALGSWGAVDPIADITRQLSGLARAESHASHASHASRADLHAGSARVAAAPARSMDAMPEVGARAQAGSQSQPRESAWCDSRTEMPRARSEALNGSVHTETREQGVRSQQMHAAPSTYETSTIHDEPRSPLTMSLAPRGTEVADRRGYSIYVAAESVPNSMYRAWAEIMKDGRRVERSGLVGPRFAQASEAEQFALDWARQWIDRECRTQNAALDAAIADANVSRSDSVDANAGDAAETGVTEQMDEPARGQQIEVALQAEPVALDGAAMLATSVATLPPGVARPLPPIRQVPEPVAVNHGGPVHSAVHSPLHGPLTSQLHGPVGALRGPLRRYPVEPAALPAEDGTVSDRYPNYPELISHAG